MRIEKQQLVSPFILGIYALLLSLGMSSFVMAEETPAVKMVTSTNQAIEPDKRQKLITPRLQDGQNAFNVGNYDLAFSLWQTLATQGHSEAQVFVGLSYANGWGVDKNTRLARHWYQKAASNNNASGQFLLGLIYISGKDADLPLGVMWLNRAADNGDASAKRFLKKAKKRGWFDNVPQIEKQKKQTVETVALVDANK